VDAVALAEARGEPHLQAAALLASATVLWTPATMHDRRGTLEQAAALAAEAADPDLEVRARVGLVSCLTELGLVAEAEDEIDRLAKLVARIGQPSYQPYPTSCRVVLQLLRGEYAEAAEATEHVHATTSTLYAVNARDSYDARRFALARDLRGLHTLVPLFRDITDHVVAVRRLTAAMVLAHGGGPEARELYDQVIDVPLADDALWISAMTVKCELVRAFGDARRAEPLLEQLTPYAGRLSCNATATTTGGVSRYLGMAAFTAGHLDEADRWFLQAAEEHRAWGARPWLARTLANHSEVVLARGGPRAAVRAADLVQQARTIAAEIGMHDPYARGQD
jgi:ATP/maltotriose-dependent transcriptional regulator MalT